MLSAEDMKSPRNVINFLELRNELRRWVDISEIQKSTAFLHTSHFFYLRS